jgi:hypothetical protein
VTLDELRKMAMAEVARFDRAREQAALHRMGFPNDPAETIARAVLALVDVAEASKDAVLTVCGCAACREALDALHDLDKLLESLPTKARRDADWSLEEDERKF